MRLKNLSPILWTKNLNETISFDETVLGFYSKSNFPNFASLTRDDVEIMFIGHHDEPEGCNNPTNKEEFFPKPLLTGSLFMLTNQVDELWIRIRDRAAIKTELADREYYMCDDFSSSITTATSWYLVRTSV